MTPARAYREATVMVTGASGFIGSHLCRRLGAAGAEVHAVSRQVRPGEGGIRWWEGDLADGSFVNQILREVRPDVIFHLASEVTGARNLECVLPTFRNNLMSTVHLLSAAAEFGSPRLVLAGSLEEPDSSEGDAIPCSPYAAAKHASSSYARMFHALYQLPVVMLRTFMVYGPAQKDPVKLIPYVISSLLHGIAPKLSSGTRPVDWIYVDDVAAAFLAAGQAPGIEGRTLDVGSGSLVPIREVVELLVSEINPEIEPLFGALPDRPFERIKKADVAASKAALGWEPQTFLPEGVRKTVKWYVSHEDGVLTPSQAVSR